MDARDAYTHASEEHGPEESRAFVLVRHQDHTTVVNLPPGSPVVLGSGTEVEILLDDPSLGARHATLLFVDQRITFQENGPDFVAFLNGKKLEGAVDLKPGDELALGTAQLVVGLAVPPTRSGRRALTHHEFRERLWEEMSRAARAGRPTSLVMVHARAGEGGRVSATALDSLRAGDVLGTYAHDELEFLLPDTTGETALAVVDRILATAGASGRIGLAVAPTDGDSLERLLGSARAALHRTVLDGTTVASPPPKTTTRVEPAIQDASTKELVSALMKLAPLPTPVLLTGELSSGKGVFARMLHDHGARASGPYVVVLCGSLGAEGAVEAFGKGRLRAAGWAAKARGGTLVLDEVGDLPAEAQRHLLAFLEHERHSLRVIATTHRTLRGLVERSAFDATLYDLVADEVLEVPALRNRAEDIVPLAVRFAEDWGAPKPVNISLGALARLRSYAWPGNVLELRNAMERAVRLANGGEILAEHLPSESLPIAAGEGRLREHVDSVERDAIVKALADSNHNQTHAAKRLGVSRRALIYKMEKYGLKPPPGTARRP